MGTPNSSLVWVLAGLADSDPPQDLDGPGPDCRLSESAAVASATNLLQPSAPPPPPPLPPPPPPPPPPSYPGILVDHMQARRVPLSSDRLSQNQ